MISLAVMAGIAIAGGVAEYNKQNNANVSAAQYAKQLAELNKQYQPYVKAGQAEINPLEEQAKENTSNPTAVQDNAASHYQNSDYQNYLTNQNAQANARLMASKGMSMSPEQIADLDKRNSDINNQFMSHYVDQALGQYRTGLGIEGNLYAGGMNALNSEANNIRAAGGMAIRGGEDLDRQQMKGIGDITEGAETFAGGMMGSGASKAGAVGGMMGGANQASYASPYKQPDYSMYDYYNRSQPTWG